MPGESHLSEQAVFSSHMCCSSIGIMPILLVGHVMFVR